LVKLNLFELSIGLLTEFDLILLHLEVELLPIEVSLLLAHKLILAPLDLQLVCNGLHVRHLLNQLLS